jgi:heme O synthase-like polyprenyltransferase
MMMMMMMTVLIIIWHINPLLDHDRDKPIARRRPRNNVTTAIARQQLFKYATVLEPVLGIDQHATIEVLVEAVFSM